MNVLVAVVDHTGDRNHVLGRHLRGAVGLAAKQQQGPDTRRELPANLLLRAPARVTAAYLLRITDGVVEDADMAVLVRQIHLRLEATKRSRE